MNTNFESNFETPNNQLDNNTWVGNNQNRTLISLEGKTSSESNDLIQEKYEILEDQTPVNHDLVDLNLIKHSNIQDFSCTKASNTQNLNGYEDTRSNESTKNKSTLEENESKKKRNYENQYTPQDINQDMVSPSTKAIQDPPSNESTKNMTPYPFQKENGVAKKTASPPPSPNKMKRKRKSDLENEATNINKNEHNLQIEGKKLRNDRIYQEDAQNNVLSLQIFLLFLSLVRKEMIRVSFFSLGGNRFLRIIKSPAIDSIDIHFAHNTIKFTVMIYGIPFSQVIDHPHPCLVRKLPFVVYNDSIIFFFTMLHPHDPRNADEFCYHYYRSSGIGYPDHIKTSYQCPCYTQPIHFQDTCFFCKNLFDEVDECPKCKEDFCDDCFDPDDHQCKGFDHDHI